MVCLSDRAEINDALIAISVLPKPTSPHNNLFIGLINERSFLISLETISWSSVSSNGKSLINDLYSSSETFKAADVAFNLSDSIFKISDAWSYILALAFSFLDDQFVLDSESRLVSSVFLWNLDNKLKLKVGT